MSTLIDFSFEAHHWIMLIQALVDLCLAGVCLVIWHQDRTKHLLLWAFALLGLTVVHGVSLAMTFWRGDSTLLVMAVLGMLACLAGLTLGITRFLERRVPRWMIVLGCLSLIWSIAFAIFSPIAPNWAAIPFMWTASAVFGWLGYLLLGSFPKARLTAVITTIPFWLITLLALGAPFNMQTETRLPSAEFYVGSIIGVVILGLGLLLLHHHQKHEALLSAVKSISVERKRASRLIDESPIGIIVLSTENLVAEFNRAASTIIGLEPDRVIGQPFDHLVKLLGDEFAQAVSSRSEGSPPVPVALSTSENGSHAHVLTSTWLLGTQGEQVVSLQDITVETHLRETLGHQQRLESVGLLAGGVAHDFNNLLVGILGYAELLQLDINGETQVRQIGQIQRCAKRAAQLTQKLLAFSRKQVLQPKLIDLRAVIEDVTLLLRRIIGERVEFVTELGDQPILAEVDPGQFEQVVVNLATNAKLAMSGDGRLLIRTEIRVLAGSSDLVDLPPGHYACLVVEDNGVGMSPELQKQIFDPFFTTRDVGKGTGLGLSTVHGIVRQSKGGIIVRSELGKGTSFSVLLPESTGKPVPIAQSRALPGPSGSGRILVVEDEKVVIELVADTLKDSGYEVIKAVDGAMALEMAKEHGVANFDLLLTDVVMPAIDGPHLAAKLREQCPALPVLFVSGYPATSLLKLDQRTAFMSKPFSCSELLKQVTKLIEQ